MTKECLLKDSFYLSQIRKEIEKRSNAYEIVFEISLILRKWENQ